MAAGVGEADVLVPLGGGSTIDTAKAVSAETGLPVVSIPTTYSGAEWTPFFGVRDAERRQRGGGAGAHLAAIVYEPRLTLALPQAETVGTALNALAHCAEALYAEGHNEAADAHALAGARLIDEWLPVVVERPDDLDARTELLRGACHAGAALGGLDACARPRARAGARRALRPAARRDERARAAGRAPLQRGGRPGRSGALRRGPRNATIPPAGSRSSRASAASAGCATSASRRTSSPRSPKQRSRGRGRRRIRAPQPQQRPSSSSALSGE